MVFPINIIVIVIPILIIYFMIIIPEYREYKFLTEISKKLDKIIKSEKHHKPFYSYWKKYQSYNKNRLICIIEKQIQILLNQNDPKLEFKRSISFILYKKSEKEYKRINKEIDKLMDKFDIINLNISKFRYRKSYFSLLPTLEEINYKLDKIISQCVLPKESEFISSSGK